MRSKEALLTTGFALLIILAGFVSAYWFVEPAPPSTIRIATGAPDGAYHRLATRYAEILARSGVTLVVEPSAGSVENLQRLVVPEDPVDLAFVQGGIQAPEGGPSLVSLGSMFYEPVWVFYRGELPVSSLAALRGLRLGVGVAGSGTRVLALDLLAMNGIDDRNTHLVERPPAASVEALAAGELDALFLVASPQAEYVSRLNADPQVRLLDFGRSEAYQRLRRYMSTVVLPQGILDLANDRPDRPMTLLAVTANLVAREDLHPALVDLLLQAAAEVHRNGGLFERPREFPTALYTSFDLNPEAERFYESGPSFLQRYLPFWAATLVDRMKVLLLPILGLMIPIMRVMPSVYRWQARYRIFRWYSELQAVDPQGREVGSPDEVAAALAELERMETEVTRIQVPLAYADELYDLRLHMELVRKRLRNAGRA